MTNYDYGTYAWRRIQVPVGDEILHNDPVNCKSIGKRIAKLVVYFMASIVLGTTVYTIWSDQEYHPAHRNTASALRGNSLMIQKERASSALLPSPNQTWAHATNSLSELKDALDNDDVTAIEADVLMGHTSWSSDSIPIMSHPPSRHSDLSLEDFLYLATGGGMAQLQKHTKIDLKETAALPLVFEQLENLAPIDPNGKTIFLNRDILPGPGHRLSRIDHDDLEEFFQDLKEGIENFNSNVQQNQNLKFAVSLGHSVDNRALFGYSMQDMDDYLNILKQHHITNSSLGIVYPANARLALKNLQPIGYVMDMLPDAELLIWTGYGEPSISQSKVDQIREFFIGQGTQDRVGFDCKVASSYARGIASDTFVNLQAIFQGLAGRR